jgi:hypothetical protein
VFGMGTGVSDMLSPPNYFVVLNVCTLKTGRKINLWFKQTLNNFLLISFLG